MEIDQGCIDIDSLGAQMQPAGVLVFKIVYILCVCGESSSMRRVEALVVAEKESRFNRCT